MIADNGVIIRTHVNDISTISRVSQGVKVMKLRNGSHIVSVAVTKREEDENNENEEDNENSKIFENDIEKALRTKKLQLRAKKNRKYEVRQTLLLFYIKF